MSLLPRCPKGHSWSPQATVPLCCPVCGEDLTFAAAGTIGLEAPAPELSERAPTEDGADSSLPERPGREDRTILGQAQEDVSHHVTGEWSASDDAALAPSEKEESDSLDSGVWNSFSPTLGASGEPVRVKPAAPKVPGYEILSELGRGAMGVVYKARQVKLDRTVALKMILSGTHATPKEVYRFELEAEALAHIRHPNIIQVYDSGEVNGTRYISMEFVSGGDLADRICERPLPPLEAAHIVEQLARGMDAAHRAGVIHRDLKPANVLIADCGLRIADSQNQSAIRNPQSAIPKITDFGLAKKLDDDSKRTRAGAIMGTPAYMAPEQAEGRNDDIGPAADIHALGAILYDCLTGRPPFQGTTLLETLEQVKVMEPLPLRRLRAGIPRDLEIICLKCLQKERHKRYAYAGDLAEDLRRFRAGEPIAARPVPWWERLAKWCRRRPAAAALVALVLLSVVGAGVGGLVYADYKHRQAAYEAELRAAAETARAQADEQRLLVEQQRQKVEKKFQQAQQAIDAMLTRIGQERLQHEPRMEAVRRDILEQALHSYNELLQEHSADPAVRYETARVLRKVGDIRALLGATEPARKAYREALVLFDELRAADPERVDYRQDRAANLMALGNLLVELGYRPEAEQTFTQVRDDYRDLVGREARPAWRQELATASYNRARVLQALGRGEAAEGELAQAIALQTQLVREDGSSADWRRELARSHALLGDVQRSRNRWEQAVASLRQALELYRELGGRGATPQDRQELALAHQRLGNAIERTPGAAAKEYSAAVQLGELLAADFPTVPEYRRELANALMHHGTVLLTLGQRVAAERDMKRALALKEKLAGDYPRQPDHRRDLATSLINHAAALATAGRNADSLAAYQRAAELLRELAGRFPQESEYGRLYASALLQLAVLHLRTGDLKEAETTLRQALTLCAKRVAQVSDDAGRQFDLAQCRYLLATTLQLSDRTKEAEPLHRAAHAALKELAALPRAEPAYGETLANSLSTFGELLLRTERTAEGVDLWREASAVWERLAKEHPERPNYVREQALTLHNLGAAQVRLQQLDAAEKTQRAALEIRQRLARQYDKEPEYQMELAASHNELGVVLSRLNRPMTAEANYREAIRIVRAVGDQPAQWQQELLYQTNLAMLLTQTAKLELAKECEKRIAELKAKLAKRPPASS